MKESEPNSRRNTKTPLMENNLIELSLMNFSDDENEEKKNDPNEINELFPQNVNNKNLSKKKTRTSIDSNIDEEEEDYDKRDSCNCIPGNYFSFCLIYYILIFLIIFLCSYNSSYLTLPYIFITLVICLLSNVPEKTRFYSILSILRIFLFPFVCIYSFGVLIFKTYIFSKIIDNDSYASENEDFILNMGIFYIPNEQTPFNLLRSIGPETILFMYSLFFSLIILLAELKCFAEYPIYFDNEKKSEEKTQKKIRRRIKLTYLLLLIFAYFNPSFTCFSYIVMFQICLGLLANDNRGLINKRYCAVKTIIIFAFFIFTVQIGMNNIFQINRFQMKYLLNKTETNSSVLTCKNVKNIWTNLGINCTYNISFLELIYIYIGFAFSIFSFISIENLIRILSNGTIVTNEDYYKDNEEKNYVDDTEEVSWIVRKIKNFFLLIVNFIEKRSFISHLCRFVAIIHINYCQNIYSLVVFFWLFLSFLCNDIKSTKCYCIFILIPVLIISSLCYNLSNFNIFNVDYSGEETNNIRDIYTFLGLKKLNENFYFSFISCHIFFLLIITFISSLENKIETISLKPLTTYDPDKNDKKSAKTGVLHDISMLSVDSLISMNTKKRKKTRPKLEETKFENKLKDLLQKNIKNNSEDKKKDKNKNLKLLNILFKKFLNHINKINLIFVYLICVSSVNIMNLVLVFIFILNVISSIIDEKKNKRNIEMGIKNESKIQYYVTKITLIIIQLTFLFEFFIDLYKCFFVYSKTEEEKKSITEIMSFILNYKEGINDNSCESLLYFIVYFYYFDYQIYLIKNKRTNHKDLEELLNDDKITFYLFFKQNLKYTFFIYDYFIKIINHMFIWIYTFILIFFLCYFELNIFFSIQLLLFLISIYLLLYNIQTNINDNNSNYKKHSFHKDILVTYVFLFFSVGNTFIVYLYQFICHDYLSHKIEGTFLVYKQLSYIGLKKYSGNLYIKLLPFFIINFISTLFLNELDNFQKRIEKESKFYRNNYVINNNINNEENKEKEKEDNENLDYTEQYKNCKNNIVNIKIKLFGANVILVITKIYWIFLFLIISGLFSSYYFSLSILIYIIIFGITFIMMFKEILNKNYNYSINDNISEESSEIIYRIKVNRNHREIAFRFLVAFSFLIFFLYYIYGIFDIAISYCEPKLWIGCDNEDNEINYIINGSPTIGFIKSLSFIFGVYYDAKKKGILSIGWVHLFLCFLFCFDVYIQKIENYVNTIKTKIVTELDEKTLESIFLRQKSLESQVDELLNPNKKKEKNYKEMNMAGSLREEIGKKIVGNLSEVIKIINLCKLNAKRKKGKKKLMLSIKCICEEVIILVLIIGGIKKINIWSLIYFIYVFYLICTKNSIKKFYYFYCFLIIGIIIQILLFVTNIQKSMIPEEDDTTIFNLIKEHLGIPWIESSDLLTLSFIFGTGIDKKQTETIYYDFFLIVIIYIYLDNFSYNTYTENISNNRLIMPFIKGNILYDAMIDNPALKNRDINISKKEFGEIKKVVKKNTFIETVNSIRYDDFLIALKKLKIVKVNPRKESVENKKRFNSEKQKLLMKLNSKTQQIFSLFEFIEIIIYLSSHNFILIINILISMMIPGVISLIYIILFIVFLFKSNSLIEGKKYYYPHFTKYIRLILFIDIFLQLIAQFFINGDGFIYKFLKNLGINKLFKIENNLVIKEDEYFSFLIAKSICFFFINLQILIYSSYDFIEYYFIYLLTLRVNQHKTAKINAFKFNNERMRKMSISLSLKEEANNTMNELQYLLEDWKSVFSKGKKKMSIKRSMTYKLMKEEEEMSNFVNEDEAKKTIKEWIMDKFLIKIYTYIHKYSSPYQNFGNNEMYELEKNIIQGETRPITYIEFLIDFYLDVLSPFHLTEQGLSIVESIINGSREEHRLEIEKNKKLREKEKKEKSKENENLIKKLQELVENVNRIDDTIAKLKGENEKILEDEERERRSLSVTLKNLIKTKDEKINLEDFIEKNDDLIENNEFDLSNIDKEKLIMYYEKAKKIILEEEEKIQKKINKYQEILVREEKHNRNKYLDDEIESEGTTKKEIVKIDLTDEKFLKFEFLRKKSILFTKYLNNSFIFSCILLDLKSCLTYNFHWFCYLLMIINHMYSPSLISFFYPLTIFCYALLENPRPSKTYWTICLYFTFTILFMKLLFTLELFTLFMDINTFQEFLKILNNYKIGFKYISSTIGKEFFSYIIFDILVIISLMIYINILVINGAWDKREQEIETIYSAMERISISNCVDINEDEIKDFNKEFLSSNRKEGNINLENLSKMINEKDAGKHRRRGRVSLMDDLFQNKIKTGKILKEERKESMNSSKNEEEEEDENNKNNKEMKKGYFKRLFPRNRNEKPGREYYPIYTGAMAVILGYILVFFNDMVRDESYASLSLEVQQFNGLMVIYFIIHVIILICDRAILLFQNQKNARYKYYLYNKKDFNNLQAIIDFRKKSKENKNAYFKKNLFIVEDELIEQYPKKKRWANHSLIIPIQYFRELRNQYYISYKQIEMFNKPLFYKYLLYLFIVIFIHFITFVYFPMKGNVNLGNEYFCIEGENCNDFQSNLSLIFFYIFYLFYLVPSALQIKNGFNDMKKKSVLKRNPNDINNLLVTIFQKIPFLNEIKNILDWTLTSTSLDLSQWIQFESIYGAIFSTYSDDRDEENVIGQKIDKLKKAGKGGVLSFILISALIFPLFIFSSINPTNTINSVYDAKLKVDLCFKYEDQEDKKYTLFENNRPETIAEISDEIFSEFNYTKSVKTRNFPKKQVQIIKFYETSDKNWDLVLPHVQAIINELNISNPENKINSIDLIIQTTFTRPLPAEAQIVTDVITANIYNISQREETGVLKAFNLSNALTNCLETHIDFYDIYRPSRKLSSSTEIKEIEDTNYFKRKLGIQLGFQGCDNSTGKQNFLQSYFTLKSIKNNNDTKNINETLSFHIFSETISPTTSSYSVYAFYTAVILVFGEYVRDFCSGEPEKVILNEMPDPKKMIELCEGIVIARNSHDFRMEKKLYFILIELLREPTFLKEITKSSVERFEEREEYAKFITTDEIE